MPRGQPTAKRQPGVANQRDTRHENGLVGPGKRVQKQKSNGHLNGHAKPISSSTTAESNPSSTYPALPTTPPPANTNRHARQQHSADAQSAADVKMGVHLTRRPSFGTYSESSSSESFHHSQSIAASHENHRRIDVNATKNPAVHRDSGPFNLVMTVLRSCPLYDTIAILIVLLQLPPTFLSLVHLLFATLTFVPTSTANTMSGLGFSDMFEGNVGTPSVATIVVVDLFVLMTWLFLWSPLQDIALDLAQTVIALTLGGGASGREAGMKNVLVCFGLIGASHFARNGHVEHTGLRALLSSSSNGLLGSTTDPDDPLEPVPHSGSKKSAYGWVRNILAIHILAQGVIRFIRDLYVQNKLRENRGTSTSIGDPEAGKPLADSNVDTPTSNTQAADDSSASFPSGSTSNTKKKRKQNNQVRARQPLWAALASTKIVVVKEYETSHTAAESAGTNATDVNNLGNAPFNTEADRIWITYVGSDQVGFSTSYFPTHALLENGEERAVDSPGIDASKPFFVRLNKTIWHATKINATLDPEKGAPNEMRWSGEIFGLAPASSYECEFVRPIDNAIIFSTRVRTVQPSTADPSVVLPPNPQMTSRPGSAATTLKTSTATAEIKLSDDQNKQKRQRKDQRGKLNAIRKEIERLANNISTSGGNDDRAKQKIQQNNLHMKQAEDAIVTLTSEIRSLEIVPLEDAAKYSASKSEYHKEKEKQKIFQSELQESKDAAARDLSALSNDLSSLQQKQERHQARITKLASEHERITDANAKGLDEAQRKESERQRVSAQREKVQSYYNDRLAFLRAETEQSSMNTQSCYAQIEAMQRAEMYASASPSASVQSLSANGNYPSDMIVEGIPSTTYRRNLTAQNPNVLYGPGGYGVPMPMQPPGFRTRGRSSSMLSNLSSFTQSDDEEPAPIHPPHMAKAVWDNDAKERHGSSGSGSGSGSVGDPKSPVVGNSQLSR
ncbi:hypothetical protein BJ875DRAFT_103658 [Amylocarpus encephaloides]|uniref:Ubiquitination network signaling protein acrB n=1 Tax=Amylocarpus encephaloides TaxID=45428 RepID=A0A9P8C2V6_9HELO|nr:hypothetical protein BJ875DRAFT_103658 [Amylocarpus encephaloides]